MPNAHTATPPTRCLLHHLHPTTTTWGRGQARRCRRLVPQSRTWRRSLWDAPCSRGVPPGRRRGTCRVAHWPPRAGEWWCEAHQARAGGCTRPPLRTRALDSRRPPPSPCSSWTPAPRHQLEQQQERRWVARRAEEGEQQRSEGGNSEPATSGDKARRERPADPSVAKGQRTAIITGAISILFGVRPQHCAAFISAWARRAAAAPSPPAPRPALLPTTRPPCCHPRRSSISAWCRCWTFGEGSCCPPRPRRTSSTE